MLDQNDPETYYRKAEFGVGDNLLTCPVDHPNVDGRWVYLPKGEWYNFWTNDFLIDAEEMWIDAPLDSLPLFVKAGSVLPLGEPMEWVDQKTSDVLKLNVYYGSEDRVSQLYEDKGDGYEYQKEEYCLKEFTFSPNKEKGTVLLEQNRKGNFSPNYKTYEIKLIKIPFMITKYELDGKVFDTFDYDSPSESYIIRVPENFKVLKLS